MFRFTIFILASIFLSVLPLRAQNTNARLLEELLNLPAPPPVLNSEPIVKERPPDFYDKSKEPSDDAPLEDLLDYWSRQNGSSNPLVYQPQPSEAVLKRLLAAIENSPEKLPAYLSILSGKPAAAVEPVKRLYNESEGNENLDYNWRNAVREWLKYNSNLFAAELLAKVRTVKDENNNTAYERELFALARVDWDAAEPLMQRLLNDKTQHPRSAVSALWAYYQHALDNDNRTDAEKYRDELKKIVQDRSAPPSVRDKAMDALVLTPEWEGRDEWYLSLLDDESLFELKEGNSTFTGLTTLISHSKPGKWVPAMIKLVGHQNPAVHNAAVRNLLRAIALSDEGQKEAVKALLPWLTNPAWAKEVQSEKAKLLESLATANLPEAVPGLIALLANDESEQNRLLAAKALANYKDPRAVPALKLALAKETDEGNRQEVIAALVASNGLTDGEQMMALEAYATLLSTPEGLEKFEQEEEPTPVVVSIGSHISAMTEPSDSFAAVFFERLKFWQKTNPAVANVLTGFAQKWNGRIIFAELLHRIETGKGDATSVMIALARRRTVREKAADSLLQMRGAGGTARGIAAVLTEDQNEMLDVLGGKDAEAQIALLATARLIRASLPVAEVGAFLNDKNNLLALAAERYLETEDSRQARELVLSKHPNEALILGARTAFVPNDKNVEHNEYLNELFVSVGAYYGWGDFSELKKFEEKLRAEAKENDKREIYALLSAAEFGHAVVRAEGRRAVLTFYENAARRRERVLTDKELEALRVYLDEKDFENQPPTLEQCHHGCPSSEFVILKRNGGRRVFQSGYPFNLPQPVRGLHELFRSFLASGEFRQIYYLSEKIPGLEILSDDDNLRAVAVWKNEDDLRVLIEDRARGWEILREIEEQQRKDSEAEIENFYQLAQQRTLARKYEHFAWRAVKNGKLGDPVAQPQEVPVLPDKPETLETQNLNSTRIIWQQAGNFEIRPGRYGDGLWKISESQAPKQIAEGQYSNPIVTADGKWAVAAKAGNEGWHEPNGVVRINLQTGKEFKINLPPADDFYPVTFVPAHGKILLRRAREEMPSEEEMAPHVRRRMQAEAAKNPSPKTPEYYLLDAATGVTEPVKGEFRPLEQQTIRPLQSASQPNTFWAAIPEESGTAIGLYDAKTFAFSVLLRLPSISFNSMDAWFDEASGKFYFVHEGHLLALLLAKRETAK